MFKDLSKVAGVQLQASIVYNSFSLVFNPLLTLIFKILFSILNKKTIFLKDINNSCRYLSIFYYFHNTEYAVL